MNEILNITVDATLEHCLSVKSVQQLVQKMRRNVLNLGVHIIKGYPIFETLKNTHTVCIIDLTIKQVAPLR